MAVDIRHLFAGVLTFALFAMLINMIKTDYFDSPVVNVPESFEFDKVPEQNLVNLTRLNKRRLGGAVKPCWSWPSHNDLEESKGFITFSLTRGPEYHVLQVANAVLVARHLGAALVLPDIIGDKPGDKRKFEDIYDVHRFVESLNGVVRIANMLPVDMSEQMPTLVMVPYGASEHYITSEVEPLFKQNGNLKLVLYFPTSTVKKNVERMKHVNSVSCLSVFKALRLQVGLKEIVDSMLESIRSLSQNPDALFVAVDFRVEMLQAKGCMETITNGRKKCYGAQEIGQFLKKIGFPRDTVLYLSQNGWDKSLDALKDIYPNTYTKESLMPTMKIAISIISEISLAKIIDFHMCFRSDVFIPAMHNLFQSYVVGARIASDKTVTLVPSEAKSVEAVEYMSPYITKKTHPVYSCFC